MPEFKGAVVKSGKGYTAKSIELMDKAATKYADQAKKIARALEAASLEFTLYNIKDFLFSNFQYKADDKVQNIHVLSSAWENRENGIDCKSYATIGSQIFQNLGIKHYFRKIKQSGDGQRAGFENEWSHVYLIVPTNQKTGALDQGYTVIDGVVEYDHEPPYTEFKDHFMNPHNILAGPTTEPTMVMIVPFKSPMDFQDPFAKAKIEENNKEVEKVVSMKDIKEMADSGCSCTEEVEEALKGLGKIEYVNSGSGIDYNQAISDGLNIFGDIFGGNKDQPAIQQPQTILVPGSNTSSDNDDAALLTYLAMQNANKSNNSDSDGGKTALYVVGGLTVLTLFGVGIYVSQKDKKSVA